VETTKAAVADLVGTFAVVFIAAGATITSGFGLDLTGVAFASGLAFAVLLSVSAHLETGMLNPAIALALWVVGRRSTPRTVIVVTAQVVGAVAAGLLLRYLVPGTAFDAAAGGTPAVASGMATGKAIVIEAVCAFVLVFVVFGALVDERGAGGLGAAAAGLAVSFAIMAFGPFTGAALNPVRWFGPALASGTWADWYVWIVGPVAGGIIAAVLYATVFLRDRQPATP
jgi:glycerol uptake facilitator-like aquaporin